MADERTLKVYKEGLLFKRQRGLHKSKTKNLSFQERFCRITSQSLDYYDPKKRNDLKGQFAVDQIRVVEILPPGTFGPDRPHVFQIGDNTEVMYFAAKTQQERDDWVVQFRRAATDAHNRMQTYYHKGVYGLAIKGRWTCCGQPQRTCQGCSPVPKKEDLTQSSSLLETRRPPPFSLAKQRSETVPFEPSSPSPTTGYSSSVDSAKGGFFTGDSVPTTPGGTHLIRSFTLADPVLQRQRAQRARELRQSRLVQSRDFDDLVITSSKDDIHNGGLPERSSTLVEKKEEEEGEEKVKQKEEEEVKVKQKEEEEVKVKEEVKEEEKVKEGEAKGGVVKVQKGFDIGELSKIAQELKENNVEIRSGSSSPCPSIDSGKGTSTGSSRPSSQVIHLEDLRTRCDSVGKRSNLSVQSDQGVVSDDNQPSLRMPGPADSPLIEEPDGRQPSGKAPPVMVTHGKKSPRVKKKGGEDKEKRYSNEYKLTPESSRRQFGAVAWSDEARLRSATPDNDTPESKRSSLYLSDYESGTLQRHRPRQSIIGPGVLPQRDLYTRLQRSCKDGNLVVLQEEINADDVNLEQPCCGDIAYTPLLIAFMNDHYQAMICLLERGANPNTAEPVRKWTILHYACEKGSLDVVELMLKYHAEVNQKDHQGRTPLTEACRHGHSEIVELLLRSGADVEEEDLDGRTPLHEASIAGHSSIAELLIREGGANLVPRDENDATPYDLAFMGGHKEVMRVLQSMIPEQVRPYTLLHSHTLPSEQMVTTLRFRGSETLVSGSRDCHTCFWNTADLSVIRCQKVSDTVLSVDLWKRYLAIGTISLQLIDMDNLDWRRTIADDIHDDEDLLDPPLHLVAFGPKGQLATAGVEGNIVKLWPPPSPKAGIVILPDASITVGEDKEPGCVYSLAISPNPNNSWLAVSLQPGSMFNPQGNKVVYLLDLNTREVIYIFDAGSGGLSAGVITVFSPDGMHLAIGCAENLCIWEAKTATLLCKFTPSNGAHITSLSYSPDGNHLAAGLASGEVQVYEATSSSPLFALEAPKNPSPATSLAYSGNGNLFAVGHANGMLQLWEGRRTWLSAL